MFVSHFVFDTVREPFFVYDLCDGSMLQHQAPVLYGYKDLLSTGLPMVQKVLCF